jgi:glycerol-3-phosphate acyltransferase PlsY
MGGRGGIGGSTAGVVARSYLIGSIPFAGLIARLARKVDLRNVDTGTVSGTGLYRVAGWRLLFVGGALDLAKGIVVVLLVDRARPGLRSAAAVAAVAGHNWSVFLKGAGGRGLSPALGATVVHAPEGTVVLGAGLAAGKLSGQTGLGSFLAQAALPIILLRRGRGALAFGLSLTAVMWLKRLLGNSRPVEPTEGVYRRRLIFDHD